MRNSTKYPFRYTWTQMLSDAFWLVIILTMVVKVTDALTK
jgi:hypothetical protein